MDRTFLNFEKLCFKKAFQNFANQYPDRDRWMQNFTFLWKVGNTNYSIDEFAEACVGGKDLANYQDKFADLNTKWFVDIENFDRYPNAEWLSVEEWQAIGKMDDSLIVVVGGEVDDPLITTDIEDLNDIPDFIEVKPLHELQKFVYTPIVGFSDYAPTPVA
jgi:hypothetical protein